MWSFFFELLLRTDARMDRCNWMATSKEINNSTKTCFPRIPSCCCSSCRRGWRPINFDRLLSLSSGTVDDHSFFFLLHFFFKRRRNKMRSHDSFPRQHFAKINVQSVRMLIIGPWEKMLPEFILTSKYCIVIFQIQVPPAGHLRSTLFIHQISGRLKGNVLPIASTKDGACYTAKLIDSRSNRRVP